MILESLIIVVYTIALLLILLYALAQLNLLINYLAAKKKKDTLCTCSAQPIIQLFSRQKNQVYFRGF